MENRLLAFGLALLAVSSCVGEVRPPDWAGTEADSAGIRLIHNPAVGLWAEGEGWGFSETLTIGADAGDPNYEFGRITDVAVGPDGDLFVLDGMAGEIKVFDGAGAFLRAFGGRGEGPGEFSAGAAALCLTDGGRLVVPDMGNQRISWISLHGEPLASERTSYSQGFPVRWDCDGHGTILVQRRAMGFNENADLEAGDPLARIDARGVDSTLVLLPKAQTVWMEGATPRFRYFATEPSWDLGPSRTLRTAMTAEYRIELRGSDGAVHTVITKDSPFRPVTEADRERFLELMRAALVRMDLSPGAIQSQISNLSFGDTLPVLNQVMEGPGGTTLIQQVADLNDLETLDLSVEMSRRLGSLKWDVFDSDGRFLGEIQLPPRFTPLVWTSDTVVGRWMDDLDRHHLKVFAVVSSLSVVE